MTLATVYEKLRADADPLWEAIFSHPFVTGIGDGSLTRDRYEFFLKQDYIYLIDFSRVFSLASAKSRQLDDMGYFAGLLHATLETEMALHRKTCAEFGIADKALEETVPSMITTAYTNLLVRTCYEGSMADILAVLLPCAVGYTEIGRRLKSRGLPQNPFYRDWITTYASEEFSAFAEWLKEKTNEITMGVSNETLAHLQRLYVASARFEFLFFEMSWNKEMWPGIPTIV